MDPEKERLNAIAKTVHRAVRMLKMGETGVIEIGRFQPEEVKMYVWAYAFHKRKWFATRYDANSRIIYATRSPPPPWEKEDEFGGEEEA